MRIKFLSENRTSHSNCLAEHGLSVLIELPERVILFDTGAGHVLFQNAEAMGVDLQKVDEVVISHGHYDHTQGLPTFCEINEHAKVFIHEKAFGRTYSLKNGKVSGETSGIRWTPGQFDQLRSRLVLTKGVTKLTEDLVISGTIPNEEAYPPTEQFYTKGENDSLSADPMEHEQFLVVRQRKEDGTSKGIYIFSGCSHKGVVPILHYAKTLFPGEKICGLIGGLHLYNASKEVRQKVIQEVLDANIEWVMPVHCTGIEAICELKSKLGEQCRVVGAGDSFEF